MQTFRITYQLSPVSVRQTVELLAESKREALKDFSVLFSGAVIISVVAL